MGSTRLPGKILLPLAGKPALFHVIERLRCCRTLEAVVVATTQSAADDRVERFCEILEVPCFRGSEEDVLDRYYQAARKFDADPVVRITADCPVIDPGIVDEVVSCYYRGGYDVYGLSGDFPDGLDCTVFRFSALEEAWRKAELPSEREHVGPYLTKNKDCFRVDGYRPFQGLRHHRWTLDEPADYKFLSILFDRLYRPDRIFSTADILDLLKKEPDLMKINSGIIRNEGYLKSLERDKQGSGTNSNSTSS